MAFAFQHGDRPLAGYTIQRAVGRGGFGEVYYAISDGGREVALKYLHENPQVELRGVSHCINLKSPHLVSVFDVCRNADDEYFIIMEYVGGPSLRDLLVAEPNGLGVQKAAFFLRELAKGLGYLHDRGIVHRDLKPGNIFYDDGYVKIGDYGLSKFISVSRHSVQTASVGTVHYMAPEVGSGHYSRSIDIYALGVILYEMLRGRVPFEGGSLGEVLMKHLTAQPAVDELPEPFARVIRKALAKDPHERYQTVDEMVREVFDVGDVRQSLIGFNPTSLTQAAGRAAADLAASPVPSPNPPPFRGSPAGPAAGVPERVSRRLRRVEEKLARKIAAHDRKAGLVPPRPATEAHLHAQRPTTIKGGVLAITMAVVGSIAAGVIAGNALGGEIGLASFFVTLLGSAGLVLAQKAQRWIGEHAEPDWVQRLLCVVCCSPALLIGMVAISETRPGISDQAALGWLAGIGLAIVGVDWRKRFRAGTTGQLGIAAALFTGFLSLIVAAAVSRGSHDAMWLAGGLVAAICLIVQAASWFWRALGQPASPAPAIPPSVVQDTPRGVAIEPDGHSAPEASTEPLPPLRRGVTRAVWSVLAFCLFGAAVMLYLAPVLGIDNAGDALLADIACVAAIAFMLVAVSKTTLRRRAGFWRETARPVLLAVGATGLFAGGVLQTGATLSAEMQFLSISTVLICTGLLLVAALVGRQTRRSRAGWMWAIPMGLLVLVLAVLVGRSELRSSDGESPSFGWSDSSYGVSQRQHTGQRVTERHTRVSQREAVIRADARTVVGVTPLNPRPFRHRSSNRVKLALMIGPPALVLGVWVALLRRRSGRSRNLFGPHDCPHRPD